MTVEKLQLTLRANRLKNVAGAFKGTSDPYAVVTLLTSNPGEEPVGLNLDKTEVIKNTLSPAWTTSFEFDHNSEETTCIRVKVFDEVTKGADKLIGVAEFDVLRDILYSDGCIGKVMLKKEGEESGIIYAHVSEVPIGSAFNLILSLQARGLNRYLKKSALYLEIRRTYDGEVFDGTVGKRQWPIYRGKCTQSGSDAMCWSASIDIDALCDRDLFRGLELVLLEYDGKWREVDTFGTTVNELLSKSGGGKFVLRGEEAIIVDACHGVAVYTPQNVGADEAESKESNDDTQVEHTSCPEVPLIEEVVEESPRFDVAQNIYGCTKGMWAWGKSVPVLSGVLGLTEGATSKVLNVTIRMDLQTIDQDIVTPIMKKLDDAVITPTICLQSRGYC